MASSSLTEVSCSLNHRAHRGSEATFAHLAESLSEPPLHGLLSTNIRHDARPQAPLVVVTAGQCTEEPSAIGHFAVQAKNSTASSFALGSSGESL